MATTKHRILYVAAPMTLYDDPIYDLQLARIRTHFPTASIIHARAAWTSTADWRRRWQRLLPTLTGMIVLADGGWIGRGVLREVNDAKMRGLPIWHLSDDGPFRDWQLTTLEDCDLDNWLKTARVELTESTSLRT